MRHIHPTLFAVLFALIASCYNAQAQNNPLQDRNGDGIVTISAYGDSLTYGVGDGIAPGLNVSTINTGPIAGYPIRLQQLLQIPVKNVGRPGELLTTSGDVRIVGAASARPDTLILFEGTNDAGIQTPTSQFRRSLQRSVNIARSFGAEVLVATLLTPCCNRGGRDGIIAAYNSVIRDVAVTNKLGVVDLSRAFSTTCQNKARCELYNLPEGLHPNTRGYDVIAQTAAAALYGVDLFKEGGAGELEATLGVPPGTVLVKSGI